MAEESKYDKYECEIDGDEVSFHTDENGIVIDNDEIEYINEIGITNREIEELIRDVVDSLRFDLDGDDVRGSIYQMFSVVNKQIFPIIALKFLVNGMRDEVRLFNNVPSKEQLNYLAKECEKYQKYVIFPIPFKDHFTTGICDKGVFYIFDSTRQEAKGKTTTINGATFYTLYNNKKFQSELTGTCGFWTLYFCLEFADLIKEYGSFDKIICCNEINPELDKRFLDKVGNKVYNITKIILENNKEKIYSALKDGNFVSKHFIKKVLEDVQKPRRDFIGL